MVLVLADGLDNEAICNPANPNKVLNLDVLRKFRDWSLLVKPSHVFDSWIVRYNKHCKFKVKGPKGDGLFAAIQRMSLRRNGSECLDYIMVLLFGFVCTKFLGQFGCVFDPKCVCKSHE